MSRTLAVVIGALAVMLAASDAGAEERVTGQSVSVSPDEQANAPEREGVTGQAGDGPDFEPLTADELDVLEDAAAQNPELADKAGGYVSDRDILTIILVVLVVIIII